MIKELNEKRAALIAESRALLAKEGFTREDETCNDKIMAAIDEVDKKAAALLKLAGYEEAAEENEDDEQEDDVDAEKVENSKRSKFEHPSLVRSRGRVSQNETVTDHALRHGYSISKAGREFARGGQLSGVEKEFNDESLKNGFRSTGNVHFIMPWGNLQRWNQRTVTATTAAGAYLTSVQPTWSEWMYAQLVGPQLGVTYLPKLRGLEKFPRQSEAFTPTVAGVAEEGTNAVETTLDSISFTPKELLATVTTSYQIDNNSAFDMDAFIMRIGTREMANAMDYGMVRGAGGNDATGILSAAGVPTVTATSHTLSYANVLSLKQSVDKANAPYDSRAFLTSPAGSTVLQSTPKIGSTYPVFISDGKEINGEKVISSSQVPDNLALSPTNDLSALVYGNWSQLWVGIYNDGVGCIIDPYSSHNGNISYTFIALYDVQVERPTAFAVVPGFH